MKTRQDVVASIQDIGNLSW